MDLRTLIKCLADNFAWNHETEKLRELEQVLREQAAEVHELAEEAESGGCVKLQITKSPQGKD